MSSVKDIYRQGRTEFNATAYHDYAVRKTFTYADLTSNVIKFPVEANRWVLGVRLHITTAFSAGTSGKVGDSADDDGYLTANDLTQALVRTAHFVIDSRNQHTVSQSGTTPFAVTDTINAFALGGKYYTATNYIQVTIAGTLTDGAAVLEIIYDGYLAAQRDELVNQ